MMNWKMRRGKDGKSNKENDKCQITSENVQYTRPGRIVSNSYNNRQYIDKLTEKEWEDERSDGKGN